MSSTPGFVCPSLRSFLLPPAFMMPHLRAPQADVPVTLPLTKAPAPATAFPDHQSPLPSLCLFFPPPSSSLELPSHSSISGPHPFHGCRCHTRFPSQTRSSPPCLPPFPRQRPLRAKPPQTPHRAQQRPHPGRQRICRFVPNRPRELGDASRTAALWFSDRFLFAGKNPSREGAMAPSPSDCSCRSKFETKLLQASTESKHMCQTVQNSCEEEKLPRSPRNCGARPVELWQFHTSSATPIAFG